jgi:putative membrane protein insertion efficiency factor
MALGAGAHAGAGAGHGAATRGPIARAMVTLLVVLLAVYQRLVSPVFFVLGARCRFHPTCSQYAIESVKHYGAWRGSWRALKRLGRCHPFHPGGFDPPVPSESIHG